MRTDARRRGVDESLMDASISHLYLMDVDDPRRKCPTQTSNVEKARGQVPALKSEPRAQRDENQVKSMMDVSSAHRNMMCDQ